MRRSTIAIAIALASTAAHAQLIEEIIVTAQKRAENVMDVPIALTAYSGDALEKLGTRSLTDIGRFTAGVDMNNDKTLQPTYSIRGVETNDWTIGSDPAVAIYVDGVYAARGAGAEAAFVDVDRIEVLKGPQGTLFGRNATGDAIHIITHKPSQETEARLKLTGGDYRRRNIEAMYNMPLSDNVAMRITGSVLRRDGYVDNLNGDDVNEENRKNVRLSVLWDVSDTTEAILRYSYEDMDQMGGVVSTLNSAAFEAANPGHSWDPFGAGAWDAPKQLEARKMSSASLEVNHEIGEMTFTSITGWRDVDSKLLEDLDGSNNPMFYFAASNPEQSTFFSQEFRLTGATDAIKWTAGATYTTEELEHTTEAQFLVSTFESFALPPVFRQLGQTITPEQIPAFREAARNGTNAQLNALLGPICRNKNCDGIAASFFISTLPGVNKSFIQILKSLGPRVAAGYDAPWNEEVDSKGDYSSLAGYGDATWSITDSTNLTAGIRYTYDDKKFDLYTAYQNYLIEPGPGQPGIPFGLAFFNGGQPLLDSTERQNWGSWSGRLVLDHHLTEDTMVYASIANGFKSGGFNSLNFGPGIQTSYDAEEVMNYEVGLKGELLDGALQYSTAAFFYKYDNLQTLELVGVPIPSYNLRNADAEGKGFEAEVAWMLTDNWLLAGNYSWLDTEFTKYRIIPAAGETAADDRTGEPRAESPKNKFAVSTQYTWQLGGNGQIVARADYTWSDDRIAVTDGEVPDYGLTNARVSWFSQDAKWEVGLWGTNLTDEEVLTLFGNGSAVNSTPGWRIQPRMWGVDVVYSM